MAAVGSLSGVPVRPGLRKRERPALRLTSLSAGGQSASLGYDGAGNMISVSGSLFESWSLVYDDESRLTQVTYPSGAGSATDSYWYNAVGQRMRETRAGVGTRRLCWTGDRLVLVTSDDGSLIWVRDTMESGSYYTPFLATRYGATNRFPLYDGVGTVRGLALDSGALDTSYTLDAFGRPLSAPPVVWDRYRFGGAWGYITDRSGLLQLGARFYWPELGRFIQQDPIRDRGIYLTQPTTTCSA